MERVELILSGVAASCDRRLRCLIRAARPTLPAKPTQLFRQYCLFQDLGFIVLVKGFDGSSYTKTDRQIDK